MNKKIRIRMRMNKMFRKVKFYIQTYIYNCLTDLATSDTSNQGFSQFLILCKVLYCNQVGLHVFQLSKNHFI